MSELNLNQETINSQNGETQEKGYWGNLITMLWQRFTEPFSSVIFICIFVAVVVIVGGLGTWITFFTAEVTGGKFNLLMASSLATYFIAIIATVFADLSFALFEKLLNPKSDLKIKQKISTEVSLWAFTFLVSVIVVILGVVALVKKTDEQLVLTLSIIGTVVSLFLWWIVNNDNKKLKETTFDEYYNPEIAVEPVLAGKGVKNGTTEF